jgi:translation initiation factor 3 subunit A
LTLDIYGSISKSWTYLSEILFFSLSVYRISEPILFYWLVLVNMQVAKGLLTYVSQEVKDLYNLVENEFHPLDLAAKVQSYMLRLSKLSDKLSSASPVPEVQLEQYVPALEKLTTLRVLQQVVLSYVVMYYHSMTSVGQNNAHILLSSSIDVSGGLCFKNGVN